MLNVLDIVPYKVLPPKMGGQSGIALFDKYLANYVQLTTVTTQSNDISFAINYEAKNILSDSSVRYINPFLFFTINKIRKQKQISHIIFEHPYYGWLVLLFRIFTNAKIIIHSHNIEAQRFKSTQKWWWFVLAWYEKYTHRLAHFNFFKHNEDKDFAVKHYNLDDNKCAIVTYGISWNAIPTNNEKIKARQNVLSKYAIDKDNKILLFNGTLNYTPNLNALKNILSQLLPLLKYHATKYTILVCGSKLPDYMNNLEEYKNDNVVYAGFVEDIKEYFLAADIFINPVVDGGGIKTKIVEALGYNISLVTTKSGAVGVPQQVTKNKMIVVEDEDWKSFAEAVKNIDITFETPKEYYEYFYWDNITQKAAEIMKSLN